MGGREDEKKETLLTIHRAKKKGDQTGEVKIAGRHERLKLYTTPFLRTVARTKIPDALYSRARFERASPKFRDARGKTSKPSPDRCLAFLTFCAKTAASRRKP